MDGAVSQLVGDGGQVALAFSDELLCMLNPQTGIPLHDAGARFMLEQLLSQRFAQGAMRTDVGETQGIGKVRLQEGILANRDAWFAGGIEWNIGQYGHAFTTCSPLFVSEQQDAHGQSFLRLYEFERCTNLWWYIDFHLSENAPLLYAHVHIHHLSDCDTSL